MVSSTTTQKAGSLGRGDGMTDPIQNIVIVDDDSGMNLAIKRLLNAAGFQALTFPSAEALLEAGSADNAACLVVDIHLPGLSGFELSRRLQQGGTRSPVIFVTAYDDPASLAQAVDLGAFAYLTKPFPGKSLIAAVTRAIHSEGDTESRGTTLRMGTKTEPGLRAPGP